MSPLLVTLRILALILISTLALKADPEPTPSMDTLRALASSLKWQTGTIVIKNGLAKINLTDDFRFIGPEDSRKVLHEMWGNPDDPAILGMIFPKDKGPIDHGTWAVTINYEAGGYVKDDDAEKIDYADMLKKMQAGARESNPEREKEGYPSIDIVGWAAPPRYDKATHKLYWAKDIKFGDDSRDTLNYDIRVLGRRGVLILGAISSMPSFPEIDRKIPEILAMVDFQAGNQYADFDPKVDKIAEYGLATLVAGGALAGAAKLGLLGAAWKFIFAGVLFLKKAIILVIVGVVALFKRLLAKFSGKSSTPEHLLPPSNRPPPPPAI